MKMTRLGSQPSVIGPATTFTGAVRIDLAFQGDEPARAGGAIVTFEPGARTAWHTHPLGQTLIVTNGVGWTQCEGEPKVEIRAGDVIWCPAGHRPAVATANALVDVDLDLVGDIDVGLVGAEAQLVAEQEQQHQHDDDQQDHREHASSSAAAGFDDRGVFDRLIVV